MTDWREDAACLDHDPNLWFGESATPLLRAIQVCARCPVRVPCAEVGTQVRHGVWGGRPVGWTRFVLESDLQRQAQ